MPAIYAGLTIGIDIFDPGDINANGGSAYLGFVDPTTCNLFTEPAGGQSASVYDLGANAATWAQACRLPSGRTPTPAQLSSS